MLAGDGGNSALGGAVLSLVRSAGEAQRRQLLPGSARRPILASSTRITSCGAPGSAFVDSFIDLADFPSGAVRAGGRRCRPARCRSCRRHRRWMASPSTHPAESLPCWAITVTLLRSPQAISCSRRGGAEGVAGGQQHALHPGSAICQLADRGGFAGAVDASQHDHARAGDRWCPAGFAAGRSAR